MDVDRTVPTWLVVLLALFAICITIYGFFWAQGRVSDNGDFQFLAYAFLLVTFIVLSVTLGLLIERYREKKMTKTSRYRQRDYQMRLNRISNKYESPLRKALRRRR